MLSLTARVRRHYCPGSWKAPPDTQSDSEARPDPINGQRAVSTSDLVSVDEKQWQAAVKGFSILKPLFELDKEQRTRVHVEKMAKILNSHSSCHLPLDPKHMKTRSALSVLLRNGRSDRGGIRVSNEVDAVIQAAIKKIYLVVEQPLDHGSDRRSQFAMLQSQAQKTRRQHHPPADRESVGAP